MDERIELKWKCGHTATFTFGYSHNELKAKMHLMASTLNICDACQAKIVADHQWRHIQLMLEPNPITMTGSEKQIAWARSIRTAKYEALALVLDCLREAHRTRQDEWSAIAKAIKPVVTEVSTWRSYTRAGDIIDHRNINWISTFRNELARVGLHLGGLV
jgi:hypothetical protein